MKVTSFRQVVLLGVVAMVVSAGAIVACVGDDGVPPTTVPPVEAGVADVVATTPPGSPLGTACTTDGACGSGHCADGVCCDTACNGVCESCVLAPKGTCSAIAANTDPDNECVNQARDAADAGGSYDASALYGDGGVEGGTGGLDLPPDGGSINVGACAGSCDGKRACAYPAAETACGPAFCQTPTVPESYHCDGKGSCAPAKASCSDFVCNDNDGTCRANCGGNGDCQGSDYCNASGACVPKKDNGQTCTLSAECKNAYCVSGTNAKVCCNSACNESGMQCDVPGQEGSCSCGGLTCTNGCQLFYLDSDGDKHGDLTGTIGAGTAVAGCSGPPTMTVAGKTYYPKADDCDDADPNVFPGQTAFFDTANPKVGYDYDCSGQPDKEQPEYPGETCKVCTLYYPSASDVECYAEPSCSTQCCGRASLGGFRCGFSCPNGAGGYECCAIPGNPYGSREGFEQTVACGASAPWHVCGTCNTYPTNTSATPVDSSSANKTQRCH